MAAAAPTLTPVTLELGGKSPVIVAADADIDVAARRIAWVKLLNSGQTCIAPDYVLADHRIVADLVDKIVANVRDFRADEMDPWDADRQPTSVRSTGFADQHHRRQGGHRRRLDGATLRIEPTVIVDPSPTIAVMADEIFGPLLPVLTVESLDRQCEFVNRRPKPLALYVFASGQLGRDLIDRDPVGRRGGQPCRDALPGPALPFGGVGASGMGAYHGRWGFDTISHRRAVLSKPARPDPSWSIRRTANGPSRSCEGCSDESQSRHRQVFGNRIVRSHRTDGVPGG